MPRSPGPPVWKQTQTVTSPQSFALKPNCEVQDKVFDEEQRREVQSIIRKKIAQQQNLKLSLSLYNNKMLPNMMRLEPKVSESIREQ